MATVSICLQVLAEVCQKIFLPNAAAVDGEIVDRMRVLLVAEITPESSQLGTANAVVDLLHLRVVGVNHFGAQHLLLHQLMQWFAQVSNLGQLTVNRTATDPDIISREDVSWR